MWSAACDVAAAEPRPPDFAALRAREFQRLDRAGEAYLDYTVAALYPESLVRAHARLLLQRTFGNPHSGSRAARRSTAALERARERVLGFLDADPAAYDVVFTANATAAIRLAGALFPFRAGSRLAILRVARSSSRRSR